MRLYILDFSSRKPRRRSRVMQGVIALISFLCLLVTAKGEATPTPTATPTATPSATPTVSPTTTQLNLPTPTPTPSLSATPYVTLSPSQTPPTPSCSDGLPAKVIFENCYNKTYVLVRRGFPSGIAEKHMRKAVRQIVQYISTIKDPSSTTLSDECIPVSTYSSIFTVKWTLTISEEELDDMLLTVLKGVYYLETPTQVLPEASADQKKEKDDKWAEFYSQMLVPINQVNYSAIGVPSSVKHLYDSSGSRPCTEFWKFATGSDYVSATIGIKRVLKRALDLTLMGCDQVGSWQIVCHYTAYIHLGIRCNRVESENLVVADVFNSTYNKASLRLLKQARDANTLIKREPMSDLVYESIFPFIYEHLSSFQSWGHCANLFSASLTIKNLGSFAANIATLQAQMTDLAIGATYARQASNLPVVARNTEPDCATANNVNGSMQCEVAGDYCYFAATWTTSSWYENCCNKAICETAITILPEYSTYEACCEECNQVSCNPVIEDAVINVPNSGDDDDSTVYAGF